MLESKTLASEIMGEGTPLILLHGLFASKSNLRLLAKRLAEKYQVHALDLPLHGGSREYLVSGLDDMALAVEGYIRLHGLDMPVLVGHSLGEIGRASCRERV